MGYKRAGFQVLGNVEIAPKMNNVYKANHHPKYNFCMDIRDFNKLEEVPNELMHLDILDGSPPCSTFSLAGSREDAWGKEKVFREGQEKQRPVFPTPVGMNRGRRLCTHKFTKSL